MSQGFATEHKNSEVDLSEAKTLLRCMMQRVDKAPFLIRSIVNGLFTRPEKFPKNLASRAVGKLGYPENSSCPIG